MCISEPFTILFAELEHNLDLNLGMSVSTDLPRGKKNVGEAIPICLSTMEGGYWITLSFPSLIFDPYNRCFAFHVEYVVISFLMSETMEQDESMRLWKVHTRICILIFAGAGWEWSLECSNSWYCSSMTNFSSLCHSVSHSNIYIPFVHFWCSYL